MSASAFKLRACISLAILLAAATPAYAQTCANPIEVPVIQGFNATTCGSPNNLPYVANGAISILQGENVVYHVGTVNNPYAGQVSLQPEPTVDLALFVCRAPCSTYSTCFAVADNGPGAQNVADIPAGASDFYIIVGHVTGVPTCGNYSLDFIYPLSD
jgi:hypothetical protein